MSVGIDWKTRETRSHEKKTPRYPEGTPKIPQETPKMMHHSWVYWVAAIVPLVVVVTVVLLVWYCCCCRYNRVCCRCCYNCRDDARSVLTFSFLFIEVLVQYHTLIVLIGIYWRVRIFVFLFNSSLKSILKCHNLKPLTTLIVLFRKKSL